MFNNTIGYLLLDEIEKMSRKDQNVLLNVIETGMLIETKVSKTRSKQMKNLRVFASTNNIDALSRPLRSRFMEFHLPEYTLISSVRYQEVYSVTGLDILIKFQ